MPTILRSMTSPRIIFLDLDGVLLERCGSCNPQAMEQLNRLCEITGASVVLTSARLRFQPEKMLEDFLVSQGFTGKFHPDILHRGRPFSRGQDIDQWRAEHDLTLQDCVILDDHKRSYKPHHQTRLVQPCYLLEPSHLVEALALFQPPRRAAGFWRAAVSAPGTGASPLR